MLRMSIDIVSGQQSRARRLSDGDRCRARVRWGSRRGRRGPSGDRRPCAGDRGRRGRDRGIRVGRGRASDGARGGRAGRVCVRCWRLHSVGAVLVLLSHELAEHGKRAREEPPRVPLRVHTLALSHAHALATFARRGSAARSRASRAPRGLWVEAGLGPAMHPGVGGAPIAPTFEHLTLEQLQLLHGQVTGMNKLQLRDLAKKIDVTQHKRKTDEMKRTLSSCLQVEISKRQRLP